MADPILPLIQIPDKELERSRKAAERKKKKEEKEKERNKKATAKQKNKKSSKSKGGPFAFLETTNDWLERVPNRMIAAYYNFIGNGEKLAQSKVDEICTWLAWKVNIAVERKRQIVIKILHEQYKSTVAGKVMAVAGAIKKFCNDPLGALGDFATAIFGPIAAVFAWVIELAGQIVRLGFNLANIMNALPPEPPNPHINYDKFKLKVKSISMNEVISDPNDLPAPEEIFPEPPKPFTKNTFKNTFEKASANLKSSQMKYTLSDEDAAILSGFESRSLKDIINAEVNPTDFSQDQIF